LNGQHIFFILFANSPQVKLKKPPGAGHRPLLTWRGFRGIITKPEIKYAHFCSGEGGHPAPPVRAML
jgi:hypothetical protein